MRLIATLFILFLTSRALVRLAPGDPLELLFEDSARSGSLTGSLTMIRSELGLDQPFLVAFYHDSMRLLRGDLGHSIQTRRPIAESLGPRLLTTGEIAFGACLLGAGLALLIASASLYKKPGARSSHLLGSILSMLPLAWLGPLFLYIFAVRLEWATVLGSRFLPVLTLGLHLVGPWSSFLLARLSRALNSPVAVAARAKGANEVRVFLCHVLAPNAGSLFVVIASHLGSLLGGAFVVEVVFNRKGLGTWMVDAVLARDYPVVEACVFVGGALSILVARLGFWTQKKWSSQE